MSIDNDGTPDVPNVVLAAGYDANGRRASLAATIATVDDFVNDYTRDNLGRLTRIEQTDGAPSSGEAVADKRIDLAYNADGTFDAIDRYEDLSATDLVATSTYGYDDGGRLTSLDHDQDTTSLAAYTWSYDAASRITQFTSDDGTADYTYDNTGQLTAADFDFQTDESYEYDENGNRTNTGYTAGDNNQLESDGTYDYEYDAEGNRTKRTEISSGDYADYEWDHRNRLVAVEFRDSLDALQTRVTYAYDPFDRLIERSVDEDGDSTVDEIQRFIHHGGNIVLVFDASDNLTTRLLHGPAVDQLLAQEDVTAGETYWTLADNQQTVRDVADYDATLDETTVVNHLTYGAFGEITSESDSTYSPFQSFTGRIFDAVTGLSWYRARWYEPAVGRFISEDPAGFAAGDANLARYVSNSPLNFVDPSGLTQQSSGISQRDQMYRAWAGASGDILRHVNRPPQELVMYNAWLAGNHWQTTVSPLPDRGLLARMGDAASGMWNDAVVMIDQADVALPEFLSAVPETFADGRAADSMTGALDGFAEGMTPFFDVPDIGPIYDNTEAYDNGSPVGGFAAEAMKTALGFGPASRAILLYELTDTAEGVVEVGRKVLNGEDLEWRDLMTAVPAVDGARRIIPTRTPRLDMPPRRTPPATGAPRCPAGGCDLPPTCFVAGTLVIREVVDDRTVAVEPAEEPGLVALAGGFIGAAVAVQELRRWRKRPERHGTMVPGRRARGRRAMPLDPLPVEPFAARPQTEESAVWRDFDINAEAADGTTGSHPVECSRHAPRGDLPLVQSSRLAPRGDLPLAERADHRPADHTLRGATGGSPASATTRQRRSRLFSSLAILLTVVAGGFCGTLVGQFLESHFNPTPAIASQSDSRQRASTIEAIRVGQRVRTADADDCQNCATNIDPQTWRLVRMRLDDHTLPDGTPDPVDIESLQPLSWIHEHKARPGAIVPVPLDLAEMGLPDDLPCRVLSVAACPPIESGSGRVVLNTVTHLNNYLFDLIVEDETGRNEEIRTTGTHKFKSATRADWVSADTLTAGETLEGIHGPLSVASLTRIEGTFRVYNLTVEGEHVYRVSDLGVLVHNNGCRMTPDQEALKDLVDEATLGGRRPLTPPDADTVLDWADEFDYPGWRAGPADVAGEHWIEPHIHIPGAGRGGHVPIDPGVNPRINPNLPPRIR